MMRGVPVRGYISDIPRTPALVYDETRVLEALLALRDARMKSGFKLLFPLKSFSIPQVLQSMLPLLDGFAVSSPFEATLARYLGGNSKSVHYHSPSLSASQVDSVCELCDSVSLNSISQWNRHIIRLIGRTSCGIRVNPELSLVGDDRYNPCRNESKLGIPISLFKDGSLTELESFPEIMGLHFHTNCESCDFEELLATVRQVDLTLSGLLQQVKWVNVGGGYLVEKSGNLNSLVEAALLLKDRYEVDVFFEPGKGIVGRAGYILASVVDMFDNGGRTIAILDTCVNHMPEVFEYQYKPEVAQESENGEYLYVLAGASCLAGDLFGEYRFDEPLEIGSRIVFEEMGAYTLVKANMFNGINLPTIYAYTLDGKLEMKREFTYEDFLLRCGANVNVATRERNSVSSR